MKCNKCGKDKNINEFYLRAGGKNKQPCKSCRKEYQREYQKKTYKKYAWYLKIQRGIRKKNLK